MNMKRIKIDNIEIEFEEEKTVLQLARDNDIYIPSLCYHKKTGSSNRCRICLVEVEGMTGLQASCSLIAKDGMTVNTNTSEIIEGRKMFVNLLLSDGSHNCLSCEASGKCELQQICYHLGIEKPGFYIKGREALFDSSSEMIIRESSKCIKCGRCIDGCNKTVVNEVLDFSNRGIDVNVICNEGKPMGKSTCLQCGECVQLCPTGALFDKKSKGKGRFWELKKVNSLCPYCGVGCEITLHIDEKKNKIIRITGVEGSPVNDGMLCIKGRYGFDFVNSEERLQRPLIKENGMFKEVTWKEAISCISNRLNEIKEKYGADAIGGLASAKVTNEENFLFQKFMRTVIGTNNVDHCARLCHSSTVEGLMASLGSGAMTNDISGICKADVILITGSDTSSAHPVIAYYIKQAVRFGKTKLIVCDPKEIDMAKYAAIYAQHRCGTDVALINGLMNIIISNDWYDKTYVEERCEGFEELKEEVEKYPPERVSTITGISIEKLKAIAELFSRAKTASVFYSMGLTQHTTGTDNVWSIANLQMLCGNIGKDGGGINPLRGQCNVQGACDMGALPDFYSGYQKVSDEHVRRKFENAWAVKLPENIGLTLTEMFINAQEGKIKGMYIMGENPVLSEPDVNHSKEALMKLDFLVVQDIFLTETAHFAHVVLPAASFAEKDGIFTNTERRVQKLRKAMKSPGEAMEDWIIIQNIANAMGCQWDYHSHEDIQREISSLTSSYGGITWERLENQSLQWPCPAQDHPGTPWMHKRKFVRGKGLMKAISFNEPAELPDEEYPFLLTTGRVLEQYHTGTMSRKTEGLNNIAGPMIMISVRDAEELAIGKGETVKVSSRRGEINIPAFVTKRIGKGTVFIPFHYVEAAANILTNPVYDPVAKIPEYKVCAVKIERSR